VNRVFGTTSGSDRHTPQPSDIGEPPLLLGPAKVLCRDVALAVAVSGRICASPSDMSGPSPA